MNLYREDIGNYLIISLRKAGQTALFGATSTTSNIGAMTEKKRLSMGSFLKDAARSNVGDDDGGIGSETR
jgi:hypothetical protein